MQLTEQYRPRTWEDVVGQDAAIAQLKALERRGLGGRAYWIDGSSGTGKSSIAGILARKIAHELAINGDHGQGENAKSLDTEYVRELPKRWHSTVLPHQNDPQRRMGRAWIFNEAHNLRSGVCEELLTVIDDGCIPAHCVVIFTTNFDEDKGLFEGYANHKAFLDRCKKVNLSRRIGSTVVATRALQVAKAEGLAPNVDDETLLKWLDRLAKDSANSFRAVFDAIEDGYLLGRAERLVGAA